MDETDIDSRSTVGATKRRSMQQRDVALPFKAANTLLNMTEQGSFSQEVVMTAYGSV
jgi:hypothetical protein